MKFFKLLGLLVIVVAVAAIGVVFWYQLALRPMSVDATPVSFVVVAGEGSDDIANNLKTAGLIRSANAFEWYAWRTRQDDYLQPGTYSLEKTMNLREIVAVLSRREQRATNERTITIIEGWNNYDIAEYFEKQGIASAESVLDAMQHKQAWWDNYSVLKDRPSNVDLEGYLFPDTYRVYADASVNDILEKMVATLEQKLTPQLRAEIAKQGKTTHEILTMASIIEREVHKPDDQKMVSDIFWKRLKIGMALQSDATINYITNKGTATPSLDDLQVESPYNTYRNRGLPPGPIANPGLNAITAAVYPTPNLYYFYLTTLDTGQIYYGKDHDEHVRNKQLYLK
jgi:UPF0755 protein